MSTTATTAPTCLSGLSINPDLSFSDQLNQLRVEFESNEAIRTERLLDAKIAATQYFLTTLLSSPEAQEQFQTNALSAAGLGKKLVQLTSWSGRGPVHVNTSLCELLDTGDLIARMQDWLDETYGSDGFRVFHYPIRNSRTTALTVSWDKAGFENADGIIRANRERAQQRSEYRSENRDSRSAATATTAVVAEQDGDEVPQTRQYSESAQRQRFNGPPRGGHAQGGQRRYNGPPRGDGEQRLYTPRTGSNSGEYRQSRQAAEQGQDERPRSESYRGGRSQSQSSGSYHPIREEADQRPRRRVNYD